MMRMRFYLERFGMGGQYPSAFSDTLETHFVGYVHEYRLLIL